MIVKIMLLNNASVLNKELIRFVSENLESCVRVGLRFSFQPVDDTDKKSLIDAGITELPYANIGPHKYTGTIDIIGALKKLLPGAQPARRSAREPEDELRAYQESEMTLEMMRRDEAADSDDPRAIMEKDKAGKLEAMTKARDQTQTKERQKISPGAVKPPAPRANNVQEYGIKPTARNSEIKDAIRKDNNSDDMLLLQMLDPD